MNFYEIDIYEEIEGLLEKAIEENNNNRIDELTTGFVYEYSDIHTLREYINYAGILNNNNFGDYEFTILEDSEKAIYILIDWIEE